MSIDVPAFLDLKAAERAQLDALARSLAHDERHLGYLHQLKDAIEGRQTQAIASLLATGMEVHGPVSPLLLITQSIEVICELYRRCGVGDDVRDATLFDIRRWIDEHAVRNSGQFGLSQLFWIARLLSCRILQLGSLQFEPKPFGYPYRIYQARGCASPLVVAESGVQCDSLGYLDEQDPAFITALEEHDKTVCAHQVDLSSGRISCAMDSFPLDDLVLLCDRETEILNVHIPKGVDFSSEAVDASLRRAVEHFPTCRLFVCTSWLVDPALGTVLDEGSNIVRFMRRFSKFPVPFSVPQLYERVFGYGVAEVVGLPATTRLQRAVQQAIEAGVVFRTMGGVVMVRGASPSY